MQDRNDSFSGRHQMAKESIVNSSQEYTQKATYARSIHNVLFRGIGLPLILGTVTFLLYLPSLKSDFVYDAKTEIFVEGFITSPENLPNVLSFSVLHSKLMLGDRPGQLLYLMLIALVWDTNPLGYHLCNNLLHAANVALLFILLRRLITVELGSNRQMMCHIATTIVVLLFAFHPIAVEPVSGISFSSDLLVTFFTLSGLLAATLFHPENLMQAWRAGCTGTLCAFAAVTCKESGVAAAFLMIVYWFLYRRREAKLPWLLFLSAAVTVTTLFLIARFLFALPAPYPMTYLGGSLSQVPQVQPRLWVFMMSQLLWPTHLSASYTAQDLSGLTTAVATPILFIVILLQYKLAEKSRLGAMGVATYWLGLITVSNFIPLYRPMADRFYYLPLAGVAMQLLALYVLTLKLPRVSWIMTLPLLGGLLPLARLTLIREEVFSNDFNLWSDTVKVSPFSSTAHNNLGLVFFENKQLLAAANEYQKALQAYPDYFEAHYNLGLVLSQKGQFDEAVFQYRKALELCPNMSNVHDSLGLALLNKGQVDEAIIEYRKALEIDPNNTKAAAHLYRALIR